VWRLLEDLTTVHTRGSRAMLTVARSSRTGRMEEAPLALFNSPGHAGSSLTRRRDGGADVGSKQYDDSAASADQKQLSGTQLDQGVCLSDGQSLHLIGFGFDNRGFDADLVHGVLRPDKVMVQVLFARAPWYASYSDVGRVLSSAQLRISATRRCVARHLDYRPW